MTRFRIPGLVLLTGLLTSCAEMAPPPGGPPDLIAPRILGASPESLATGIDPAAPVTITFSEKVSKDLLSDWIFIRPFRRIDSIDWNGAVAAITFRGGLPQDTTIAIEVGDGVSDRHGNRLAKPFRRTFATGSRLDPGIFAGEVRRTRAGETAGAGTPAGAPRSPAPPPLATSTGGRAGLTAALFVWAYRAIPDSLPDLAQVDPDYLTEVGPDGTFRLDGLPVDVPLRIFAIYDADRSRTFAPERDFAAPLPDTLVLSAGSPAVTRTLFLIDPKAPGTVSGRLAARADTVGATARPDTTRIAARVDTTRIAAPADTARIDTLSYGVILSAYPEEPDSIASAWPPARAAKQDRVSKTGTFTIRSVPPGRYRVAAFVDADRNGSWSRTEEPGQPVVVTVRPDEETGGVVLARPPAPAGTGP